jgi:carboxypeptidase family protein
MNLSDTVSRRAIWVCRTKLFSLVVLGSFPFSVPAFAQLNLGRIVGVVTDQTGGVIAGATVTVIDEGRGVSRPLVSDGAGQYAAPGLTPGTYTVRGEAPGFQGAEHKNIAVGVGEDIRVDLTLMPGAQTQTITVTEELPMVNTTNAQLGGTLDARLVDELPVNGRNFMYLVQYKPGVLMKQTGGQNVFTIGGSGIDDTNFLIDGLTDFNLFGGPGNIVGGTQLGADQATILPLDSIQEMNVVMNPKAEYGDRFGGDINVGLKSGTNSIHGTAYAFGRDDALNAKNPFLSSALPKAPMAMEQFGASLGGPIMQNKLFYFANYEGQRYYVGNPKIAQEPTTTTGPGSGNSIPDAIFDVLHNPANTTKIPSALSLNIAGCQGLVPTGAVTPAGILSAAQVAALQSESAAQLAAGCSAGNGVFGNSGSNQNLVTDLIGTGRSDNSIVKFDYHPTDHHSMNIEWFTGGGTQLATASVPQPYWDTINYTWVNMARIVWIWTPGSAWVNEARVGYEYLKAPIYQPECATPGQAPDYAAMGLVTGAQPCDPNNPVNGGFPGTTISGFTALGFGGFSSDRTNQYYTFADNVSYTRGTHLFKFGGLFRPIMFNGDALRNNRGTLIFGTTAAFPGASPLDDFLTGVPSGSGTILVGDLLRHTKLQSYAAYVQDDWRILKRLTLNLGLRYEYTSPLREQNSLLGNFDPANSTSPTGLVQQTSSSSVYRTQPHLLGPRFGFAWDVFGNGRTVVRGGIGLLYTSTPILKNFMAGAAGGGVLSAFPTGFTFYNPNGSTFAGPGTIQTGNVTVPANKIPWAINTPIFNVTTSALTCGNGVGANPAPCQLAADDPNWLIPYGIPRNLGVQHAFTTNLSVDVEYVGLREPRIISFGNLNAPTPGIKNTTANSLIEQARGGYTSAYPFFSNINFQSNFNYGNYDALQTTLTQRVTHGLNFSVGYTWSHNLDTGSGANMIANDPQPDYGNSANDSRHVLTFAVTYQIPGGKSPAQLLEGWQLNSSFHNQSAGPVAAADTSNDLSGTGQLNDRWTLVGAPSDFKIGYASPAPCWGVAGSSFSKAANCTTVPNVASMPSLCQTAAAGEPTNAAVPASDANSTGLKALANFGCYMTGNSAIVPPAQGTYGTMGRDALSAPPFRNWNLSVTKNWKFTERYSAQFRAEFFNIINQVIYAPPNANLAAPASFGASSATPDSGSNPVIGPGPRKVQFGLKILF